MLPTRPRAEARSTCTSCVTPCSITATRVSCGVTLMRISSVAAMATRDLGSKHGNVEPLQELGVFRQRQSHDTGIAAFYPGNERRGAALNRIRARLVVRLAACDVEPDLGVRELAKPHARDRDLRFNLLLER